MKQTLKFLILTMMVLMLSACSSNDPEQLLQETAPELTQPVQPGAQMHQTVPVETQQAPAATEAVQPDKETKPVSDPWSENPEIFGTPIRVTNNSSMAEYHCYIPDYSYVKDGADHRYIKCESDHIILMGLSDDTYPEPDSLENAFEAFIPKMENYLDNYHNVQASDHTMIVKKQTVYDSSERPMMQIRGTLTFLEDNYYTREWTFLGFTTQLSNGHYAYFLSAQWGDAWLETKRIAVNMANSFSEVQ